MVNKHDQNKAKNRYTIDSIINSYFEKTTRPKIFCIGQNKTGTTSLKFAFEMLGFKVGNHEIAGLFLDDWAKRDFSRLIRFCERADAFQDIPFSINFTYQALDQAFPNAKFILTIRNSAEEWYQSWVRFTNKFCGKENNALPTVEDLQQHPYIYQGFMWRFHQLNYGVGLTVDKSLLFDRQLYINYYHQYNQNVINYFRYRPQDLLILNLADNSNNMEKLCNFLGVQYQGQIMPHDNKSQ